MPGMPCSLQIFKNMSQLNVSCDVSGIRARFLLFLFLLLLLLASLDASLRGFGGRKLPTPLELV